MTMDALDDPPPGPAPPPRRWLVKEEPAHYAYADLERDGRTGWDSVRNPLAQRNLRAMRTGELVLFYHSGDVRAVAGIAEVSSDPHLDPADARGGWTVEVRPIRPLRRPVGLAELKGEPAFRDSPLVRIGRLSVLEISEAQWDRVVALEAEPAHLRASGRATTRRRRAARGTASPSTRAPGRRRPPRPRGSSAGARSPATSRPSGTGR